MAFPDSDPAETAELYRDVDHLDILAEQNRMLEQEGKVSILGTCVLFVADYSRELSNMGWIIRIIDYNGSRRNMGKAVKKWQSDIEYLISGGSKKVERVQIDRIF